MSLTKKPNVALFITCLTDQYYPSVGVAVTRILEKFGCNVSFPQAQTCCGQPFFNNGFHAESLTLAKRWIEIFEPYDYVVSPSGSCVAMVREQFAELFRGDPAWETDSATVSHKAYEFVEFLTNVLKVDLTTFKLPTPTSITYQYTCHLRGLGMTNEGVKLLRQMGNVDFRPMEKTDQCCGFGGTFAIKYPAISQAMVEDKANHIRETRADVTVCNEAGCTMNIAGMCHKAGVQTRVRHLSELMAEAMGIDFEKF